MVTGSSLTGPELEARLRDVVSSYGGAAVDVSGQRTTLRLSGSRSRDVLGKGCALDLHPSVFGGAAAQTTLGQTGVILLAVRQGRIWFARRSPGTSPIGCSTPPRSTYRSNRRSDVLANLSDFHDLM